MPQPPVAATRRSHTRREPTVTTTRRRSPDGAVLQLRGLTRVHGRGGAEVHALHGVDLTVLAGELVAVMGPSGSGKSTLLTLAGGLDSATSGEVLVEGQELAGLSRGALSAVRRRAIGYVFQDFNLIPTLTAAENVSLPRELDGVPRRRSRAEAEAALAEVGVAELADRFPDQLSGGQQQRVAIARALIGERRLVLADEPTGALDSATGESVLTVLRARCDAGAAAVMVTHEPRHAEWADRVVMLHDGRVVAERPAGHPVERGAHRRDGTPVGPPSPRPGGRWPRAAAPAAHPTAPTAPTTPTTPTAPTDRKSESR
ncbi:ABC transporter ATP-binding protein [Kitasatospora sp. NPDC057015]|uniref:ABC transporter ATP-binding protein n=1 Tax=Kitasatospora sp. NPDC057015 TaxID=3346001 RepID=UPI0036390D3F